ncbi:P-loop containing nucleoside triphosphate hydrolase protein [Absidia repens]|uniref:p-loop containing nucleoside triphosphate hydrolase protein n=1 Tax=Absidia repens TaxID=90262 RepID=A0A1X2IEX0_9FUNG|nr:P-loop containing nucleoside triphosphate hydrolase protein [Absidia repens]
MTLFYAKEMCFKLPNGQRLFENIEIKLKKGDRMVIQGPSGCGKTTLLKCLAHLIPFEHGECTLENASIDKFTVPNWRTKVMYVPQTPVDHPGTPNDLFKMVRSFASQKNRTDHGDPIDIARNWGISDDHFAETWSNLSGGEMQRCALAIALALNPQVLLLDGND